MTQDSKIKSKAQFEAFSKDLIKQLENKLKEDGSSDHGLIDYILELWRSLKVPFDDRIARLSHLQTLSADEIYFELSQETEKLAQHQMKS